MTEEVTLASLMTHLTRHTELDVQELQDRAARSDAAQQNGEYKTAIEAAQALVVGLVQGIAQELRRPRGEPVAVFRARKLAPRSLPKCCRFLEHKRFFGKGEQTNVERAWAATVVPSDNSSMNLEAWSRIARQIVFTTVEQITTRYDEWKAGCSCSGGGPVELVIFQPVGNGSAYELGICPRCRCPRRRAVEPRGVELPEAVEEALRSLDKRELLAVCVRNIERLCGVAAT